MLLLPNLLKEGCWLGKQKGAAAAARLPPVLEKMLGLTQRKLEEL